MAPLQADVLRLIHPNTLKAYKEFPYGMPTTHAETINADFLAFFKE
jgi:non-heme chloroperoxidase